MPPDGFETITVATSVVDTIDTHKEHIGANSRSEAIQDLVRDDTKSIERRLAAIESELKAVEQQDGESFTERVKTLEEKLNDVLNELDDIRDAVGHNDE